mmetsp:Transcript_16673/g.23063  ORF Transcript_16673/g.23063 Transcript_16673/m.23063 type:complete len:267 (+) Transcript_16673:97-897(+)
MKKIVTPHLRVQMPKMAEESKCLKSVGGGTVRHFLPGAALHSPNLATIWSPPSGECNDYEQFDRQSNSPQCRPKLATTALRQFSCERRHMVHISHASIDRDSLRTHEIRKSGCQIVQGRRASSQDHGLHKTGDVISRGGSSILSAVREGSNRKIATHAHNKTQHNPCTNVPQEAERLFASSEEALCLPVNTTNQRTHQRTKRYEERAVASAPASGQNIILSAHAPGVRNSAGTGASSSSDGVLASRLRRISLSTKETTLFKSASRA